MKVNYRKLARGRYFGRSGKFYVFIYMREHGKWDGFDRYQFWYTARIGKEGTWLAFEGRFTSYLKTIRKAKNWAAKKIIELDKYKM